MSCLLYFLEIFPMQRFMEDKTDNTTQTLKSLHYTTRITTPTYIDMALGRVFIWTTSATRYLDPNTNTRHLHTLITLVFLTENRRLSRKPKNR